MVAMCWGGGAGYGIIIAICVGDGYGTHACAGVEDRLWQIIPGII